MPRFLIVDDLPANRQLFRRLLELHFPGSDIFETGNGREACEMARREQWDVAIVDVLMPSMSGFDLCRALKKDAATASTLILMVSAFLVDTKDRISGLESGADGYLCKPFENDELIAQIRALLRIREKERALQESHRQLEEELAARRRAEAATEEARRAAVAAANAKSEFLAHMSHEIRTPLNAIIGMTELLQATSMTPLQRDYVETIRSSGETLLGIINQILDLSRIEAGRVELERRSFSLTEWLDSTLSLVRGTAERKGLALHCRIREGAPARLCGDVVRLRQLLGNLLSNAVKFTDHGSVSVDVSTVLLDDRKCELRVAVKDTGIGIPANRMSELFQPFHQLDASPTRRHGGSGLGLVISKRLAELMGGGLWVESTPGAGSTFRFSALLAVDYPEISDEDLRRLCTGEMALVVDDNPKNLRLFARFLSAWGFHVQTATSPKEAIERLQTVQPFALAIVDMRMPEMDGLTFLRRLAELDVLPRHTIVCSSEGVEWGSGGVLGGVGSRGAFVSALLNKPVRRDDLRHVLGAVLQGGSQIPDTAPTAALPDRVLVAEDNPINQKVLVHMLERIGVRADVVENGEAALQRLRENDYPVVLMDVEMPILDGVEAARRIRAEWPSDRRPWIIAVTAHAMRGDREKYLDAGMDDYISKPLRVQELRRALAQGAKNRGLSHGENSGH